MCSQVYSMDAATLRERVITFFSDTAINTLIVCGDDIIESSKVVNQVIRELGGNAQVNVVLCICDDPPIFITPRSGIALNSKVLLLVPEIPGSWSSKSNVVTFGVAGLSAALESMSTGTVNVNKMEE